MRNRYDSETLLTAWALVMAVSAIMFVASAVYHRYAQTSVTEGTVVSKHYEVDDAPRFLVEVRGETSLGFTATTEFDARERNFDQIQVGDTIQVSDLMK